MLRTAFTARRRVGSHRRVLATAAGSLVVASVGLGTAMGDEMPSGQERRSRPEREPVLGATSATATAKAEARRPARDEPQPTRRSRPTVVQALAPGQAPEGGRDSDAGPPRHIRKENVRLRRELDHLKALEAERRRVSRALKAAGLGGRALVGSGRLIWPITGPLTSPFGQRWGRLHAGIDIAAAGGTPIRAADSGRVVLAGWQGGYGLYTCVRHTPSLSTCYAHQSRLGTTSGASVRKGEVIGYVGTTGHSFGNHLHFETWVRGQPVNPMGFL